MFTVTYQSAAGFDAAHATGQELATLTPSANAFLKPTVIGQSVVDDVLVVRYRLTNQGQPFTAADDGVYALQTGDSQPYLTDRDGVEVPPWTVGPLTVAIA